MMPRHDSAKLRVTELGLQTSVRLLETDVEPMPGHEHRGYQGDINEVEHKLRGYWLGELENKDGRFIMRYVSNTTPSHRSRHSKLPLYPQYLMSISTDTHSLNKGLGFF
jgi:hypothetical protein